MRSGGVLRKTRRRCLSAAAAGLMRHHQVDVVLVEGAGLEKPAPDEPGRPARRRHENTGSIHAEVRPGEEVVEILVRAQPRTAGLQLAEFGAVAIGLQPERQQLGWSFES